MRFIRHLLFVSGIILCSSSSFGQSSFGFREMASDSIFMLDAQNGCDICFFSILFHRRFEFIEHKTDSVAIGKREFNCLSPNNGIRVYQFYLNSVAFDTFIDSFSHICQASNLVSRKIGCDSLLEFPVPEKLTYSNYYFELYEIEDSVQTQWYAIFNESIKDIYLLFANLEKIWNDKKSPSYLTIHEWTKYYKRQYIENKGE